ncbi:MAG: hypothetical protein KDE68_02995 [Rhodocyclaceae bacterium]|nr:hypothetical protein [Rhodocyclaceae bacterium]
MSEDQKPIDVEDEAPACYDDAVLNAGWLPQPESVSPEPAGHPPVSSPAAEEDAEAFLKSIYRSQG